jgi:deoxyadenosine/deoxycytidine kinase
MRSVIVSVEGNIGSGKSTFVKSMEAAFAKKGVANMKMVFVQEPVNEWTQIKDNDGVDMLTKFYGNQEKYAFAFQMMAYISRLSLLKRAYEENSKNTIIVTERSVYTDRYVFAKMLYDSKKIEEVEYQIYLKWFNEFINELPVFAMVYLHTTPEVSHARVLKRAREGEAIPLEYLKECFQYHEDWLSKEKSVLMIDVSGKNHKENTERWTTDFVNYLRRNLLGEVDQNRENSSVAGI